MSCGGGSLTKSTSPDSSAAARVALDRIGNRITSVTLLSPDYPCSTNGGWPPAPCARRSDARDHERSGAVGIARGERVFLVAVILRELGVIADRPPCS